MIEIMMQRSEVKSETELLDGCPESDWDMCRNCKCYTKYYECNRVKRFLIRLFRLNFRRKLK